MLTEQGGPRGSGHTATDMERPRLSAAIRSTLPGGMCLLSAPRGYGATTAVTRALAAEPSVHWCHRQQTAPQALRPHVARALGLPSDCEDLLDTLARLPEGWLVLDGLGRGGPQEWEHDQWEAVQSLAERLPGHWRLVVVTAGRLPAPVLALAARPGSLILGTDDLAFTDDEAVGLLQRLSPTMDDDSARLIAGLAEGWVTALAAAAAQAKSGRGDPLWLSQEGADALFANRLAQLPKRLQDVLIHTAELDLLNPELATAVYGSSDAGHLLRDLDDRKMYLYEAVAPAGQPGRWWRRHGLLTLALRHRDLSSRTEQHNRAADWFAGTGDVSSTMRHLLGAGRTVDAGRYLTEHELAFLDAGRAGELLVWYRQLPDQWNSEADHMIRLAWGQVLSGDIRGADITLARVEAHLAGRPAIDPARLPRPDLQLDTDGERNLLTAYLGAFHADPATMVLASRRALEALGSLPDRPGAQLAPLLTVRGLLWSGRTSTALAASDGVLARNFTNESLRECHRRAVRSLALCAAGRIREAAVEADRATSWVDAQGLDPLGVQFLPALAAMARVRLESGRLDAAHALATDVATAARRQGNRGQEVEAMLVLAACALARDRLADAVATLQQAQEVALGGCPTSELTFVIDEQLARARIAAGDLLRAQRLAQRIPSRAMRTLVLGRATVLAQPVTVIRNVEAVQPVTPRIAVERHLVLATAHLRSSPQTAQVHIQQAAAVASQHGLALALLGSHADLTAMAEATAAQTQDDALLWLLDQGNRGAAEAVTAEAPLSRGELHLLSLLPRRLRYNELADELGISINTVKTRLRKLYAKLGASSRDDAVTKARQRGLLPLA